MLKFQNLPIHYLVHVSIFLPLNVVFLLNKEEIRHWNIFKDKYRDVPIQKIAPKCENVHSMGLIHFQRSCPI